MKRVLIIAAALALAGTAFAALGQVVASFPAPANYPIALSVSANYQAYLWVYCNASPYRVYRLAGLTGSVYSSWVSPRGSGTRGLSYHTGGNLWMGSYSTDYCYRCNPNNGSVYASWPANHDMSGGLAIHGGAGGSSPTALFASDTSPRGIWRHHLTTGSILSSFAPSQIMCDLAWDYDNKLIWGGTYSTHYIYGFYTNGNLVASFRSPANNPWGLTYYGNYLWVSTTTGTNRIWRIHVPTFTQNIHPTSVGRVKAIFK
ncbi:MAG: hypothetical protein V3T41_03525 [bacterium]